MAKSEVSSSEHLVTQDAVSCCNGVEVVFILVDDDTYDVAKVPLPLSTTGTDRATLSAMLPACSSMRDLLTIFCLICQTLSCPLPFTQNAAAAQSKWRGTEWRRQRGWQLIIRLRLW